MWITINNADELFSLSPQKTKFFKMMMALKTELASTGDPRSEDMEAIRELAAERWEKMTPEEKDHFKS